MLTYISQCLMLLLILVAKSNNVSKKAIREPQIQDGLVAAHKIVILETMHD